MKGLILCRSTAVSFQFLCCLGSAVLCIVLLISLESSMFLHHKVCGRHFPSFLCFVLYSPCPCSVGAVFFSALSLSIAIIVLHGAFREPDNLFLDEAEVRAFIAEGILYDAHIAFVVVWVSMLQACSNRFIQGC
jgi:hypothetical protein